MDALRSLDPVFLVLVLFGLLGLASWLLSLAGLIPRLRIRSGKPPKHITRVSRTDLRAQGFTQVTPWVWRKER